MNQLDANLVRRLEFLPKWTFQINKRSWNWMNQVVELTSLPGPGVLKVQILNVCVESKFSRESF